MREFAVNHWTWVAVFLAHTVASESLVRFGEVVIAGAAMVAV